MPNVRPVTASGEAPQVTLTGVPQVPEKTCINGFCAAKLAPTDERLMVGLEEVAVYLYHTSYAAVPPEHTDDGPEVNVALTTVPAVVVQVAPDVKVTALPQRSFAGGAGSCIQILNVARVVGVGNTVVEYILT